MKPLYRLTALFSACALLVCPAFALTTEQAYSILNSTYYYTLPDGASSASSLDELFSYVSDPYTYYMSAEKYSSFTASLDNAGTFTGLGTLSTYSDEGIRITRVYSGSGAEQAGIKKGDIIIAINGESCVPASIDIHQQKLMGDAGSTVNVTVLRNGSKINLTVIRSSVAVSTTYSELIAENTGYIDCDSFGSTTDKKFAEAIGKYTLVDNWIVDMRDNPGGVSLSSVNAAGYFSDSGNMMYFRDRYGNYTYIPYKGSRLTSVPVIVLTNENTASAAEVFSADIRDSCAGIIVGQRTYGKGSSQSVYDGSVMPDIFDGDALKVTTNLFFSTAGNSNQYLGVIPTLLVDNGMELDVAELLSSAAPSSPNGYIRLTLNSRDFYVCLDSAKKNHPDAFDALLESLPPDCKIYLGNDDRWTRVTAYSLATSCSDTYVSRYFADSLDNSYSTEINTLATYGILKGNGNGNFNPNNYLTRAQLCAMLSQLLGISYEGDSLFSDVSRNDWYFGSVNVMAAIGFVNGTGDGRFHPNELISWEEYVTLMSRFGSYFNMQLHEYSKSLPSSDNELSPDWASWSKAGAQMMLYAFEINGTPCSVIPTEVTPKEYVDRASAAYTLYNLLYFTGIISY